MRDRIAQIRQYTRRLFADTLVSPDYIAQLAAKAEAATGFDAFDVVSTIRDVYGPALAAGLDPIVMAQERLYVEAREAPDA